MLAISVQEPSDHKPCGPKQPSDHKPCGPEQPSDHKPCGPEQPSDHKPVGATELSDHKPFGPDRAERPRAHADHKQLCDRTTASVKDDWRFVLALGPLAPRPLGPLPSLRYGTAMRERLAFALDYPTLAEAEAGAARVVESVGVLKVGLELFVAEGGAAVKLGARLGASVFLDLKLHDIPETVERAVATASQLGARFLTLHAAGGPRMLEAAAQRAEREGAGLTLLAVTVLTSLDAADLQATGVSASPSEHVLRLARLATSRGIPGLVCSTAEVAALRAALGPDVVLVTPGIRPTGAALGDQKRVGTPASALRDGASLLVVGRPIRDAADPAAAARSILSEMSGAFAASS